MADPVLFSIAIGVICMAIGLGLVLGIAAGGLVVFIFMKATEEP